ncbi:hypothetical protein TNCV_3349121 [Trichonephila clavipes]|nr:hypothetical protein TNCV_3349121 [Trichonephila clavipes]
MEGDSGRGELMVSAVIEKSSPIVQADEKLVCYWSSGVGERELYSLRLVSNACWWAEQTAAVRREILSSSTLGFRMPEKSDKRTELLSYYENRTNRW